MKRIAGSIAILTVAAVALASGRAWGQAAKAPGDFDPVARANVIAPFIDEQTVAVAHVDLARIAVDAVAKEAVGWAPQAKAEIDQAGLAAGAWLAGFRRAGGREVYVVVSLADADFGGGRPAGVFLVVPLGKGVNENALGAMLPFGARARRGDVLVCGHPDTLRRLEHLKPDERPELVEAFRAAGDTAAQGLLLPPKYAGRVIEEMLPTLPEEIGGGPSTVITRGVRWASLSVDLPPHTSLGLVVQSQDAGAAEALLRRWGPWARAVGQAEEVRALVPDLDQIAPLLVPNAQGDRLVLKLRTNTPGAAVLGKVIARAVQSQRQAARRRQWAQIGLAMHNYHDAHKRFPAAASCDAQGRPLLSWRVQVLPFIEGGRKLYDQFHLDEPWDSPHNRKLIDQMPALYRSPLSKRMEKGYTSYLVPVGKDTVFPPGGKGTPIEDIKDGTSGTVMVVEVDDEHAMPWTKPEDLTLDPKDPAKGLGGLFKGGFNALYCDGHVELVPLPQPAEKLRALFTPSGGEAVSP